MSAGKGDTPRNCYTEQYRNNYDEIFRKSNKFISDNSVCNSDNNTMAFDKDKEITNENNKKRSCKRCS